MWQPERRPRELTLAEKRGRPAFLMLAGLLRETRLFFIIQNIV